MISKYVIFALISIILVIISYFYNFYILLKYPLSTSQEVWGQLGDYVGGLLNPILSFFSLILLIKSLNIQNQANRSLLDDLKNKEKTEKLRSFETLFFNMIDSQKLLFNSFEVELKIGSKPKLVRSVDAVLAIEDHINDLRSVSIDDSKIIHFLLEVDSKDKLYGLVRVFYIIVKNVSDRLSDELGFSSKDRIDYINTLINFTDFSQIRLIKICIQFTDYESIKYLRDHNEFNQVMNKVGLNSASY